MSSKLAKNVGLLVFGSAISGYGFSLGNSAFKKTKGSANETLMLILIILIIIGAVYLPYKSGYIAFSWTHRGKLGWVFTKAIPAILSGVIGMFLIYIIAESKFLDDNGTLDFRVYYLVTAIFTALFSLGALISYLQRGKQKLAYEARIYNENFLEHNGIREVKNDKYTHIDKNGNLLRLEDASKERIDFFVVKRRNRRAYLHIGEDGKFKKYTGVVRIC